MRLSNKNVGLIYLWMAYLLVAAASPVIHRLGVAGANHPINQHNPISFCNVLFLGNFIAGIVFIAIYYKQWRIRNLAEIKVRQWTGLSGATLFATILGPICYFLAVMLTQVINVVLIATTEIAWTLVLGYVFFRQKPTGLTLLSTTIAVCGVGITFYLHQSVGMSQVMRLDMANLGTGWFAQFVVSLPKAGLIFAALGAFFSVMGDMITRKTIGSIPNSLYVTFRTFIGALIFFVVAISVFGFGHFADLFSPFLWTWMLFYGVVIVGLAIFAWSRAAGIVTTNNIAVAAAFLPVAGVILAFIIAGEIPDYAQIIGGIVILVGIAIGLYDSFRTQKLIKKEPAAFRGI